MAHSRLYKFLAGPEVGLTSTLVFAALYTWPLLTLTRPSATFAFIFGVWGLHVALLAATSFASCKLAQLERARDADSSTAAPE